MHLPSPHASEADIRQISAMNDGDIYVTYSYTSADVAHEIIQALGKTKCMVFLSTPNVIDFLSSVTNKIHVDKKTWDHLPQELADKLHAIIARKEPSDMFIAQNEFTELVPGGHAPIHGPDCTKSAADKLALAIGYAVNDPSGGKVLLSLDDAQEILRALRGREISQIP